MAKLTAADVVKLELPDDFSESLLVRCLEADYEMSKKTNNPMVVCQWEIVGLENNGEVETKITRNGKEYIIGGLRTNKTYHSMGKKALGFFQDFWCKAQGVPLDKFEVDTENPDRTFLKGLVMSAAVEVDVKPKRKKLTDAEKARLIEEGVPEDDEVFELGQIVFKPGTTEPELYKGINITRWNEKYNGELPAF